MTICLKIYNFLSIFRIFLDSININTNHCIQLSKWGFKIELHITSAKILIWRKENKRQNDLRNSIFFFHRSRIQLTFQEHPNHNEIYDLPSDRTSALLILSFMISLQTLSQTLWRCDEVLTSVSKIAFDWEMCWLCSLPLTSSAVCSIH